MSKIRLTKSFCFETAHALHGYDGKCKNIHGHSYKLWVTIIGSPITEPSSAKYGMVIDFGDLKKIVKNYIVDVLDHAIIVNGKSPHFNLGKFLEKEGHRVIFADYQPTCENMVVDFADKIQRHLPKDVFLHHLKLEETETSFAEWYSSDN